MFNQPTDLTPEPEWLLQSGRTDPDLLAEVLTDTYYAFLLDLSANLLEDPEAARKAALQALVLAVQNAYRYQGRTGVRGWLAGWLLQAHPHLLKKATLLLKERYGWEEAEIVEATSFKLRLSERFLMAMRRNGHELDRPFAPSGFPPRPSAAELDEITAQVANRASRTARRQRRTTLAVETLLVGVTILVGLGLFWGLNQFLTGGADSLPSVRIVRPTPTPLWSQNVAYVVQEGDTIDSIAALSGNSIEQLMDLNEITSTISIYPGKALWVAIPETAEPQVDASSSSLSLPPISAASTPGQILELARNNRHTWQSLWADFQMVTTISTNQNGASEHFYRYQLWIVQPGLSNELFGDLTNEPVFRSIIREGRSYNMAARYSIAYLDDTWNQPADILVHSALLRDLIYPTENGLLDPDLGEMAVLGQQEIAGRTTVNVEWVSKQNDQVYRLWLDSTTGLILRRQELDPATGQVRYDLITTQIVVDPDHPIPTSLFNPAGTWSGGFASDYTGKNAALDPNSPTPTQAFYPKR